MISDPSETTEAGTMRRFEERVVVVVGAGSIGPGWGNGKAASVQFAREGARVVAGDIRLEAAEETRLIIEGEGGACVADEVDVTSEQSVKAFIRRALDRYGRIDVLHNNVGVASVKPTAEVAVEEWDRIFAINLRGMFLTCREVLPPMLQQGSGAIINVASIAAIRYLGVPYASYDASKAGVIQFTKTLALEHASRGVRANVILPGFMDTPTIVESYKDTFGGQIELMRKRRNQACPMEHMGDAWDIAYAAAFLASDHARYITGIELVVDGGLTCSIGFRP